VEGDVSRTKKEIRDALVARLDEHCPEGLEHGIFLGFRDKGFVAVVYNEELTIAQAYDVLQRLADDLVGFPRESLLVQHNDEVPVWKIEVRL
jgi:hypothetical protein